MDRASEGASSGLYGSLNAAGTTLESQQVATVDPEAKVYACHRGDVE